MVAPSRVSMTTMKTLFTLPAFAVLAALSLPGCDGVASAASTESRLLLIPGEAGGHIALHCEQPKAKTSAAVLFIHGASFPTLLASGFSFHPGDSWLAFTAHRGYVACGLDFPGFGASTKPPEMSQDPSGHTPLLRAPDAAAEIKRAVDYLRSNFHVQTVHVVAHSSGTIAAAEYAAEHPTGLTSLILFGPVVPRSPATQESTSKAWYPLRAADRYQQLKFKDVLPPGLDLLEPAVHTRWTEEFARSAGDSAGAASELHIPAGPLADLADAQRGVYPYDPTRVVVPLLAVYGDYDNVSTDPEVGAFLERFTSSPLRWRLVIAHGTHAMHLERNRRSLYAAVGAFIHVVEAMPSTERK
jgi:pimeloyl-ACP methyl ester carboxylesterase